ncbi:MAG: DUF1667 domain-containing protein [Lachnospiraceae bacterium]
MKKEIICTVCPMGCRINVEGESEHIAVIEGYGCKRGLEYGTSEFAHPVRILTSTVKTNSKKNPLVPVRSSQPIPKESMFACMDEIRKVEVTDSLKCYDVIIKNICQTGIDILATIDFKKE